MQGHAPWCQSVNIITQATIIYTVSCKHESPSLVKFTYHSYYLFGQPCTWQSLQSSLTSSQVCCPARSRRAMSDTKPTSRPSWAGSYQSPMRVVIKWRQNPATDIRTRLDQRLRAQLQMQQSTSYRATRSFLESSRSWIARVAACRYQHIL